MSTQYDDIGATYEEMRQLPIAILQDANVEAAVAPFIKSAKVLDLACGTGYYSKKFSNGVRSRLLVLTSRREW